MKGPPPARARTSSCLSKPQLLQLSMSSMQEHCHDTRVSRPGREHLLLGGSLGQSAISSAQPSVLMQPPSAPDRSAKNRGEHQQTCQQAAAAATFLVCSACRNTATNGHRVSRLATTSTRTRTMNRPWQRRTDVSDSLPPSWNAPAV